MGERLIGIGETSSFRYFAITPPLDELEAKKVIDELRLPSWVLMPIYTTQERRDNSPFSTEFGIDVGDAIDGYGKSVVDSATVEIARQIADTFSKQGEKVVVLEDIVCTDWENPIFGERADEQRKTIEHFRNRAE